MAREIELRDARVRYGPLEALHGVDLPIAAGAMTVLVGRNGSGRSSALHAMAGVVPLTAGQVLWYGGAAHAREITALDTYRRSRLGVALLPAEQAVFPSLSVAENLAVPGPLGGGVDASVALFPELTRLLARTAGTLSGGEQRMVALSRVLTSPARLLLLDEFALGLAEEVTARVHATLAALVAAGRTVVLAEQSIPAEAAWDVAYELRRGDLVAARERVSGA
ncbi:ATP-binding cassette domain-containing protein [Streptacidiphilus jiangxiensis]|uniref:Branched-chain amino acid transport system ATP-binding protein n=1 Tax=Streptacidiphilus jiangxiensis TaxID=235985 RepID=A0A1H8ABW6_STRJI|nr:ATP-binding cassette domain-containing protein [Streptacidiphilus jiangxiensis]SEM67047.1 branched-chain amino acid transport system ATP-binding protein [Streptacidiphilus jiangxiensis]